MPFAEKNKIRVISLALVRRGNEFLVCGGYDKVKNQTFYRLLGGGVEFGEMSEQAVIREFKEEINTEIKILRRLEVKENTFMYQGNPGHEIIFLYEAEFADKSLYEKDEFLLTEGDWETTACWKNPKENIVFPEGVEKYL